METLSVDFVFPDEMNQETKDISIVNSLLSMAFIFMKHEQVDDNVEICFLVREYTLNVTNEKEKWFLMIAITRKLDQQCLV